MYSCRENRKKKEGNALLFVQFISFLLNGTCFCNGEINR